MIDKSHQSRLLLVLTWFGCTFVISEAWLSCSVYLVDYFPDCTGYAPLFVVRWLESDGGSTYEALEIAVYLISGIIAVMLMVLIMQFRRFLKKRR